MAVQGLNESNYDQTNTNNNMYKRRKINYKQNNLNYSIFTILIGTGSEGNPPGPLCQCP